MGKQKEQSRIMHKSKPNEEDQSSTNIRMFTKKQSEIFKFLLNRRKNFFRAINR
jgi:hypothetical protein